ncbi:MAG: DUF1156 domain-containing protein [Chloroflexota bacterium]|nr:DUF1156 domain-containing protein [Chloroflexota bacterium]
MSESYRKKLIEVALPLQAINLESAEEKNNPFLKGHPRNIHVWWARRPLAACRSVLFASLVDDPSSHPDEFPTELAQEAERQRLFRIIERLAMWENSKEASVLAEARMEILRRAGNTLPQVLDPFCGAGSIPLEAQRLGLEAHGSDLNPVAVLITKALIEIPPKFAGRPPVNPQGRARGAGAGWRGAAGLAEDVRYYGKWMRDEAQTRIGHLYPKVRLPREQGGGDATVIAWLWARTVKCPNPACGAQMPLVRSFALSTKKGREAWTEPVVDRSDAPPVISFHVRMGAGAHEGTVNRRGAVCLACRTPVPFDHIRAEGRAGRIDQQLMAVVGEGQRGRIYLSPTAEQVQAASTEPPEDVPETSLPEQALSFRVQLYGMTRHRDLFTPRQLVALTTLSDLVEEAREKVLQDARLTGMSDDHRGIDEGGTGAQAYADAIATYLAFIVDKTTDYGNTICSWNTTNTNIRNLFSKQAVQMTWDFVEANLLNDDFDFASSIVAVLTNFPYNLAVAPAQVQQADAMTAIDSQLHPMISTDPPYYDNIGYADLSDFFYVWLRRSLRNVYPQLFSTRLTPKAQELIATPYRHGGDKGKAHAFFEEGLGRAFDRMRQVAHSDYPLTVYYAFKQAESDADGEGTVAMPITPVSTGWETMLEGLLQAGFQITGTWPMRTERAARSVGIGTNALASSIVLVCRARRADAPLTTRREFLNTLKRELPDALKKLQHGNIAPVDLAQASIGPGMAIYSRYSRVVESDGSRMTVRTALVLINQTLDEVLTEQEGEYDADTRWAVAWFEQFGTGEGQYGVAETLSKAKNTSIAGLAEAGVLSSRGGKVCLLSREELPDEWNPDRDRRLTVWETVQYMIRALDRQGEEGAAAVLRRVLSYGDLARDLAYRLYMVCERKKWAEEALAYNSLVIAWPSIVARASAAQAETQGTLTL